MRSFIRIAQVINGSDTARYLNLHKVESFWFTGGNSICFKMSSNSHEASNYSDILNFEHIPEMDFKELKQILLREIII